MALTYEEYKQIPAQTLKNITMASLLYTCILAIVTMSAFATSVQTTISQSCESYNKIYYSSNSANNTLTLYQEPESGSSTAHLCTEVEKEKVPLWISFVGIGIFLIYLLHSTNVMQNGKVIIKHLELKGETALIHYFNTLVTMAFIQTVLVEICGAFLLFRSTDATDVIVNSSATLFLGEVDDLVIELFLDNYLTKSKVKRVFEFAGIEIEIDPKELPDDKDKKIDMTNNPIGEPDGVSSGTKA